MASASKKRSRSAHKNPNTVPNSSLLSLFLKEPPPGFFPSKEEFLRLLAVVSIAVSVAMACNFAVNFLNRQPKLFCDSDQTSEDAISDFCEPCPDNGECFNGKLECVHGYKKYGRRCIEDGEISQTAKKLSEGVKQHVCEAYAQFLCDGTGTIWVQDVDIWKELDEGKLRRIFGLNNDTFQYTKQKVLESIRSSLETREDFQGIEELKCPDWLAEQYKPLLCYIRLWIFKHALILVPVSTALIGFIILSALLIRRVRWSRYLTTRAEQLYQQVCDILEESAITAKSVTGQGEPWVVASRLRDHLLLPRERKDPMLWRKVEELVQEDSRVDQYPRLVKGDSKVVWEWQVEGSLSSSKIGKKGPASKVEPSGDIYESPGQPHRQSTWKVGRALYC
ncbi:uncharacterized protein LOC122069299 [Macadamia integrifolia]|uniref:uncharacterized protein LOC122069299 n=1 Tax=Macadamia integrifolia TaxID=60698 RepID=UPI001C4E6179|nr:uncharacterized protein LOC122069299 [Macadamia integrifolia]